MVFTKKFTRKSLVETLIFSYLAIFPLGQIIRLKINFLGSSYPLHPVDVIAALILTLFIFGKFKQPRIFRYFLSFLAAATFSSLFSSIFLSPSELIAGVFYLLRLVSYVSFIPIVWSLVEKKNNKEVFYKSLIAVCAATAVFGWVQYLWLPDLRDLKYIGWDDHYFRLFGTFLDPAFAGIILVFGALSTLAVFLKNKSYKYFYLLILFLLTLLLTYSRDSYLAFFAGLIVLLFHERKKLIKYLLIISVIFIFSIPFLPRSISEAAKLERTYSVFAKFNDWKETLTIFSKKPVFGVGFNNICAERVNYLGVANAVSHACGGSDSSLLLVLATTGVVGFIILIYLIVNIAQYIDGGLYGSAFKACCVALLVHSLFVNSLFYPWVMGWMAILLAISLGNSSKS